MRRRSTLAEVLEDRDVELRCRCGKRLALAGTPPHMGADDVELVVLVRYDVGDKAYNPDWLSVRCPRCRYTWQGRRWMLRQLVDLIRATGWTSLTIDKATARRAESSLEKRSSGEEDLPVTPSS